MSSLYGLLATQSAVNQIPAYVLIGCIISLLAAFTVGFVKGFRTVAWGGFYWLAASCAFVVAYKYNRYSKNTPKNRFLLDKLGVVGMIMS